LNPFPVELVPLLEIELGKPIELLLEE